MMEKKAKREDEDEEEKEANKSKREDGVGWRKMTGKALELPADT